MSLLLLTIMKSELSQHQMLITMLILKMTMLLKMMIVTFRRRRNLCTQQKLSQLLVKNHGPRLLQQIRNLPKLSEICWAVVPQHQISAQLTLTMVIELKHPSTSPLLQKEAWCISMHVREGLNSATNATLATPCLIYTLRLALMASSCMLERSSQTPGQSWHR